MTKFSNDLSVEQVRTWLRYDSDTGEFFWVTQKDGRGRWRDIRKRCGGVNGKGYRRIRVNGKYYAEHRLAWLYVYGSWPLKALDHINLDPTDNRIANLREATDSQNLANIRAYQRNTSGYKGVTLHKGTGKWQAQTKKDGKFHYLGLFDCPKDAHDAYRVGAKKYHGEFARAE